MKIFLQILTLVFSPILFSQENLVPNGSFEEYLYCPEFDGQGSLAKYWYSPNIGTSDLLSTCANSISGVSVPENYFGYQNPFDGISYAGLYLYYQDNDYREYLQCKLLSTLESGKKYRFSIYISPGEDASKFVPNNFGFLLTVDSLAFNNPFIISESIGNSFHFSQMNTDTLNWTRYQVEFISNGGESYLTIGNFNDNFQEIDFMNVIETSSYIFVDSINIVEIETAGDCEFGITPNIFTPNGDGINDYIDFTAMKGHSLYILNRWGKVILLMNEQSNYYWYGKDNLNNDLSSGVYFYIVETNSCKQTGTIHLIR